jgi:uncharacterized coiled-coil protein SlyX
MRRENLFRLAVFALIATAAVPALTRAQSPDAQSQTDSVADAARKARAEKKAPAKPAPVITDDILKPAPSAAPANAEGAAATVASSDSAAAASSGNSSASGSDQAGATNSDQTAKSNPELDDLKAQVAEAQKAYDLASRELSLEQDNVYSKPDYQTNSTGKAKIQDLTQQAADKQQTLDDLKARLAEVQAKAEAQTPPAQEPPPQP